MSFYSFFVTLYNEFLALFPSPIQWLVTLIVVIGLAAAFYNLIRHNALTLVILIVLLPFIFPVLQHFFADIYNFFIYLLNLLRVTAPHS